METSRSDLSKTARTRKRHSLASRQEGVVIVAVLWICALIMWFALRIGVETHFQSEEQVNQFRKSQALHLAIGGGFEALARMGQSPSGGLDKKAGDSWQPDGQPHLVEYQTGQAMVVVEAEQTKVNVNKANAQQIRTVFQKAGIEGGESEKLAETIVDFVNKSGVSHLHGTGMKGAYSEMGLPYGPFKGPLTSLDQMLLIPGVTPQLFYGYGRAEEETEQNESEIVKSPIFPRKDSLFSLFTIYGTNVAVAQSEALLERQEKQITWASGGVYRILSCGVSSSGPPAVMVWLIVRLSSDGGHGYQVLYRKIF
jgi:general secretion pathway protein K